MKKIILLTIIVLAFSLPCFGAKTRWRPITKGIEYTSIKVAQGKIHAIKINPKRYKFGIVTAKDLGEKSASVKSMAKKKGALVAINGGFFSPEYDSLGLLISDGKTINRLKNTSWWSVFYVRKGTPYIRHTNSFRKSSSISMAVQSGPRLVVNGSIPKLKKSFAERSAICITRKKEVIIVATENLSIEPRQFAEYLRQSSTKDGLSCQTALNLDGGRSTQLYANVGQLRLDVPGINKVTNAVVIYRK